jgi:hypothetical protein
MIAQAVTIGNTAVWEAAPRRMLIYRSYESPDANGDFDVLGECHQSTIVEPQGFWETVTFDFGTLNLVPPFRVQ